MQRVQKTRRYTVLAAIFGVLLAFGPPEARAQNETKAQETKTQETKPQEAKSPETKPAESKAAHYFVLIETTKGKIVLELYPEEAPKTVENFVTLAKKGYYDGLLFHRVVPGFVIQATRRAMAAAAPATRFPTKRIKHCFMRSGRSVWRKRPLLIRAVPSFTS
jgi:hypothetical protein